MTATLRVTSQTIRTDYLVQNVWTLAEAAKFAGVTVATVRFWRWSATVKGKEPWDRGLTHGPYQVDRRSFQRWLERRPR